MNVRQERFAVTVASRLLAASSFWLAFGTCRADVPTPAQECRLRNAAICELKGVQFMVDGPCPPPARTIRPPRDEPCDEAAPTGTTRGGQPAGAGMAAAQLAVMPGAASAANGTPPPVRDLAWVGRAERWLLPLLLAAGGLLFGGVCLLLFVVWRRRAARRERHTGEAAVDLARPLLQLVVAGACAVPLGYQAAGAAFDRVFASADNHDTALPWLLAAPLAVAVFMLVTGLSFALIALLLVRLFEGPGKGSPKQGRSG
ncbi:hypothetical protein [Accumulibacter sp.]|uniref:hypothetical protein n=1 Tax=Accumulibacter sp. TaxID=2053492 RepID=UPI0025FAFF29|nr:hypothetical protein [Accumulibacter sp.]MCP5229747.1 hypothetical protein [Accumulibacter sp.]